VIEFFGRGALGSTDEAVQMTSVIAQQLPEFVRRIHAQQMMRRSEAQNTAMLEVALDCVISMDERGLVTAWNPAAERTFGFSAREAVGRELAELIIPP
jgi:PAS domain-containing protein